MSEALTIAEPSFTGESEEWDIALEEPEFEFYIRCERVDDGVYPHSEWHAVHSVEGVPRAELTESQRQYIGGVLGGVQHLVRGGLLLPGGDQERLVAEAREARRQLQVSRDLVYHAVRSLVEMKGEVFAANAIGLKVRQVRHLMKSRRLELSGTA